LATFLKIFISWSGLSRRQYKPKGDAAELKESTLKLANESAKSIAKTAWDIGDNENTLHTWISKYDRTVDRLMLRSWLIR
jgi:transposase